MRYQQTKQPNSHRRGTVAMQHVLTLAVSAIVLINLQAIWTTQIQPGVEKLIATVLQQESAPEIAAGRAFTPTGSNNGDNAHVGSFATHENLSRMSRSVVPDDGNNGDIQNPSDGEEPPEDEDRIPEDPEQPTPKDPEDEEEDDDDEEEEEEEEDEEDEEDEDDDDKDSGDSGSGTSRGDDDLGGLDSGTGFPNTGTPLGGTAQGMMPGQPMMPGQMMPGQGMMPGQPMMPGQGMGMGMFPNQWPNNHSQNATMPAEKNLSGEDEQSDPKGATLLDKFLPSDEAREPESYEANTVEADEDVPRSKSKQEAQRRQTERDSWKDSIHEGVRQSSDSDNRRNELPADDNDKDKDNSTTNPNRLKDTVVLSLGQTETGQPKLNLTLFDSFVELHVYQQNEWKYFRISATAKDAAIPLESAEKGDEVKVRAFLKTGDSVDVTYTIPRTPTTTSEKLVNFQAKYGEQ